MKLQPMIDGTRRAALLIKLWWRRCNDRQQLMMMTDVELQDVGLTRYDVLYEASKPFWRA